MGNLKHEEIKELLFGKDAQERKFPWAEMPEPRSYAAKSTSISAFDRTEKAADLAFWKVLILKWIGVVPQKEYSYSMTVCHAVPYLLTTGAIICMGGTGIKFIVLRHNKLCVYVQSLEFSNKEYSKDDFKYESIYHYGNTTSNPG